jgi:hypothetical protein
MTEKTTFQRLALIKSKLILLQMGNYGSFRIERKKETQKMRTIYQNELTCSVATQQVIHADQKAIPCFVETTSDCKSMRQQKMRAKCSIFHFFVFPAQDGHLHVQSIHNSTVATDTPPL